MGRCWLVDGVMPRKYNRILFPWQEVVAGGYDDDVCARLGMEFTDSRPVILGSLALLPSLFAGASSTGAWPELRSVNARPRTISSRRRRSSRWVYPSGSCRPTPFVRLTVCLVHPRLDLVTMAFSLCWIHCIRLLGLRSFSSPLVEGVNSERVHSCGYSSRFFVRPLSEERRTS